MSFRFRGPTKVKLNFLLDPRDIHDNDDCLESDRSLLYAIFRQNERLAIVRIAKQSEHGRWMRTNRRNRIRDLRRTIGNNREDYSREFHSAKKH
jgi:hypothetical protein